MSIDKIKGSLVISLDLEMMWGNIESWSEGKYGQTNIANVPYVVDKMLELFFKYNVHATFATVGLLMHRSKEEAVNNKPCLVPSYKRIVCSPYSNNYMENIPESRASLYFAHDLIMRIKDVKGMEIGTHTYCHYYCWEDGQTIEESRLDLLRWRIRLQ